MNCEWLGYCRSFDRSSEQKSMTLKIKLVAGKRETLICLSGQLRCENVGQVRSETESGGPRVVLDMGEVDLVDIDAVRFLNACESAGVSILRCSAYIREWMRHERSRAKDHPEVG
jgi:hypothetical protein